MQLQHQQHFQAKKNINHKVPKDAPRLHQLDWAGQETDHALEKNFLSFEGCALLFMLLPSKVVSRCSWESNQATCQSGEWEEPEKQETYTHRRKHSTMNINNIILSFFHSYILVFIGRNSHRWSFGSLPLSPLACLVGDTSFPAISPTWLHRYYLNWTELDNDITEFNNEMPLTQKCSYFDIVQLLWHNLYC